jgi:hypothetical protein
MSEEKSNEHYIHRSKILPGIPLPKPYETYRNVNIYLFKDDTMLPDEYGACFDWYNRLQDVEVEDYERPTLENIIKQAHMVIDLLLAMVDKGHVDTDTGTFK